VDIVTAFLVGLVGFAKKLGEPTEVWGMSIVPFWPLLVCLVFILLMMGRLNPQTKHGGTLVIAWMAALIQLPVIVMLLAAFLMIMGYPVGPPK
jgi:hypothetical protein